MRGLLASVVIPTFNRAQSLERLLGGLAAQECDPEAFEILVVDNNSTDTTEEVCKNWLRGHPRFWLCYIRESEQGLSHSRNRGVREAKAEIVCILDDDAVPVPNWLVSVLAVFADPSVGCAGGPEIPDYDGQDRPAWLQGHLQGLVGGYSLPFGLPTSVTKSEHYPWGGNVAFRKGVLEQVGRFRADLDPAGAVRILGGETELITRIGHAGWKIMYVPDAAVYHHVPPRKLSKAYLFQEGRRLAATHVIMTLDDHLRSIALWFASDLWYAIRMLLRSVGAKARGNKSWFDDYMHFWIVWQRVRIRLEVLVHGQYSRAGVLARVKETHPE